MTEEQIVKALECCIKDDYDKGCTECPMHCYKGCDFHLAKFALDLINRQKAEIERLQNVCGNCPVLKAKNDNIDNLNEQIKGWQKGYCELKQEFKTAKTEAIKKFAMKLKEEFFDYKTDVTPSYIERIIEEMTEEGKE